MSVEVLSISGVSHKKVKITLGFLPEVEISNIRYCLFSHNLFNLKESIDVSYVVRSVVLLNLLSFFLLLL